MKYKIRLQSANFWGTMFHFKGQSASFVGKSTAFQKNLRIILRENYVKLCEKFCKFYLDLSYQIKTDSIEILEAYR